MAADASATERGAVNPSDILGDLGGLDALDAKIAEATAREERRFVRLLHKVGHFNRKMTNDEFERIYREAFGTRRWRDSTLARLKARRTRQYAGRRARDAGRKALLGGFVVAQCRHKPEVHARLARDIRDWMLTHRDAGVGAKNVAALEGFLADPAHKAVSPPASNSRKARKERTHRLILLGAWVLARRKDLKELGDLVADELAGFLDQGERADRQKSLLKDVLGT